MQTKHFLLRTTAIVLCVAILLTSFAAAARFTYSANNSDYELKSGTVTLNGGFSGDGSYTTDWFYSDGYFTSDPKVYDPHLATVSQILSASAVQESKNTDTVALLTAMGFSGFWNWDFADSNIAVSPPPTEHIDLTVAARKMTTANGTETGKILVAVIPRSGCFTQEWAAFANVGASGNAAGINAMAQKICDCLDFYLSGTGYASYVSSGSLNYWIVGSSLGASAAQLAAQKLIAALSGIGQSDKIYAYTCGTSCVSASDDSLYDAIHNVVQLYDPTVWFHSSSYGLTRCGQDHDVTAAFYTQDWQNQLAKIDPGCQYPSSFRAAYCTLDISDTTGLIKKIIDKELNPKTILQPIYGSTVTMPYYFIDLVGNLTAENAFFYWTGSRAMFFAETYAMDSVVGSSLITIQDALNRILTVYLSLDETGRDTLIDILSNIGSAIGDYCNSGNAIQQGLKYDEVYGYADTIRGWLNAGDDKKQEVISFLWNRLNESTGTVNYISYTLSTLLTPQQLGSLYLSFPVVINMLLRIIMRDYYCQYPAGAKHTDKALYVFGTLVYNLLNDQESVLAGMDTCGYLAALRCEDSFYRCPIYVNGVPVPCMLADHALMLYARYNSEGKYLGCLFLEPADIADGQRIDLPLNTGESWRLFLIKNGGYALSGCFSG